MGFIFFLILLLVVCSFILFKITKIKRTPKGQVYKARPILTDNEQEFFTRLLVALPEFYVFPQVSFSALLEPTNFSSRAQKMSIRGTFSQKYADYVVADNRLVVVAIVELDDRTHNSSKDKSRDVMLAEAGYRVIRWQAKDKPSVQAIAEKFALLLTPKPTDSSGPAQSFTSLDH